MKVEETMICKRRVMSKVSGISMLLVSVALCVLMMLFPRAGWAKKPTMIAIGNGQAKVTCLVGTATVNSEGQWQVRSLAVGSILRQGDQVKTGLKSRLEIILPDGSFMRFAENTDFTVQNIDCSQKEKKRTVRFKLTLGRTWASVKKLFFGLRPKTEIATTNAVCGVRGTVFRVNVNDDQSALVRTYEGEVNVSKGVGQAPEKQRQTIGHAVKVPGPRPVPGPHRVSMEEWTYIVRSLQQIHISGDGVATKPEAFTPEEDRNDWVDWNKERDEAVKDIEASLDEED